MMWLTWRQFRTQTWVAAGFLAAAAIVLGITGAGVAHLYDVSGVASCHVHATCQTLAGIFVDSLKAHGAYVAVLVAGDLIMLGIPGVVGIFWGAPLITREIETGTFRLAWNQSVTRTRWLATKLGLVGLASIAVTGLLSLMLTWWARPIQRVTPLLSPQQGETLLNRFDPPIFSSHGVVPLSYAAFAFVLGVVAGVLIRRTVPAMAVTLAVFAGIQFTWPSWVRPHLIAPVHRLLAFNPADINQMTTSPGAGLTVVNGVNLPNAWVLANQTVNASGQPFTGPAPQACVDPSGSFQQCQAGLGRMHLHQLVVYEPASRYWAFQWYESAVFLTLALALAGYCIWWVSRRRLA
jgi:hypothetical protein